MPENRGKNSAREKWEDLKVNRQREREKIRNTHLSQKWRS